MWYQSSYLLFCNKANTGVMHISQNLEVCCCLNMFLTPQNCLNVMFLVPFDATAVNKFECETEPCISGTGETLGDETESAR